MSNKSKTVYERIAQLESDVSGLKESAEDARDSLKTSAAELSALRSRVKARTKDGDIKSVRDVVDALRKDVADLKSEAGANAESGGAVDALRKDVADLRKDVADLRKDVADLKSEAGANAESGGAVDALTKDMNMLKSIFRSKLARYEVHAVKQGREPSPAT